MKIYFKSKSTFRTVASADVLSASICVDSTDGQASTVTAVGEYGRTLSDQWAVYDGLLFLVSKVTPQEGRTLFTLLDPVDAFSRPLIYTAPAGVSNAAAYVASIIYSEYVNQSDPVYALPYISVFNPDTIAFIPPETDSDGLFKLSDYIRLLRRMLNFKLTWTISGNALQLTLLKGASTARRIVFNDGHTQLSTAAYSRSGLAKLTVIMQHEDGSTDRTDYYLAEDGSVSTSMPARRAEGQWDIITVAANQDPLQKAEEAFAKNKASHKVEFYSDRDYSVYDPCVISLYGELLSSHISYKGKASGDSRWLYKSGELAVTATEKLKGGRV